MVADGDDTGATQGAILVGGYDVDGVLVSCIDVDVFVFCEEELTDRPDACDEP